MLQSLNFLLRENFFPKQIIMFYHKFFVFWMITFIRKGSAFLRKFIGRVISRKKICSWLKLIDCGWKSYWLSRREGGKTSLVVDQCYLNHWPYWQEEIDRKIGDTRFHPWRRRSLISEFNICASMEEITKDNNKDSRACVLCDSGGNSFHRWTGVSTKGVKITNTDSGQAEKMSSKEFERGVKILERENGHVFPP